MILIAALFGFLYVASAIWLASRFMREFLGPLALSGEHAKAPDQFFVTDYYVLLAQIAVYTLPFASASSQDLGARMIVMPIMIVLLTLAWFASTRRLSKARVRRFGPRLFGQILFPFEISASLTFGF